MRPVIVPFFISHAGCPHRCVFCDQEKITGNVGAIPSAAEIRARIDAFAATAEGRQLEVAFFGGSFSLLPDAVQNALLNAVEPYRAEGIVTATRISTRPDALSAAIVDRLAASGVTTVELGVQSFDDCVLARAGRGYGAEIVAPAVRRLQGKGIAVGIQLMPGLPGDTPESALAGMRRALALEPSFLRIYPTLVIDGTGLAVLYEAGEYEPWSLDQAAEVAGAMLLDAMRAGVPVVRVGLHPTDDLLRPGIVVAGPFHPAFRTLAEADFRRKALAKILTASATAATVAVPPGEVSYFVGHRRATITFFGRQGIDIGITADRGLRPLTFRVDAGSQSRIFNLLEDA